MNYHHHHGNHTTVSPSLRKIKFHIWLLSAGLGNVRQRQQHRCQEIFNKISSQEIFLHLAGNFLSPLIYWNAI
jgi:hypothetical protein